MKIKGNLLLFGKFKDTSADIKVFEIVTVNKRGCNKKIRKICYIRCVENSKTVDNVNWKFTYNRTNTNANTHTNLTKVIRSNVVNT